MYICEKSQDFRKCSFQIAVISKKTRTSFTVVKFYVLLRNTNILENKKKMPLKILVIGMGSNWESGGSDNPISYYSDQRT